MNYEIKPSIKTFKDLNAWKVAHTYVIEIYKTTKKFPKDELYGSTNQIRRSASSVTANIAEGFSRRSYKEKSNFYHIALGSLTESQDQLTIALDVQYITATDYNTLYNLSIDSSKIINGLVKKTNSIAFIHNS